MEHFSIEESLHSASTLFKKRPWFFIGFTALILAISIVLNVFSNYANHSTGIVEFLGFIVSTAASIYIGLVQTRVFIRAHDDIDKVSLEGAFSVARLGNYFLVSILLAIGMIVGFILLIIPGILFAIATMFSIYIVVDTDAKSIDAIKESMRLTKGHWWHLFVFSLALVAINILGFIALLIGLLVTLPISILATIHVYRTLKKNYVPEVVSAA